MKIREFINMLRRAERTLGKDADIWVGRRGHATGQIGLDLRRLDTPDPDVYIRALPRTDGKPVVL